MTLWTPLIFLDINKSLYVFCGSLVNKHRRVAGVCVACRSGLEIIIIIIILFDTFTQKVYSAYLERKEKRKNVHAYWSTFYKINISFSCDRKPNSFIKIIILFLLMFV